VVRHPAVLLALAAALLAGCGESAGTGDRHATATPAHVAATPTPTATPTPRPAVDHGPVLVRLIQQRPGALIDKITVFADGTGQFDRPSGGVGRVLRDVDVKRSTMRRLRRALARFPSGDVRERSGTPTANGPTYIVRRRGRTYVMRQGLEPRRLRPAVRILAALLIGDGVRRIERERLGGTAGSTHSAHVGEPKPRTLVYFQRQGAAGATFDTITVRSDGTATNEKRYGGAGGRFREIVLRRGELAKLRRALASLPKRGSITRGSPPPGGAMYLFRIHGRTLTGRAGGLSPESRPAVRLLDGYINGIGVRKYTREHATHTQ
jgi:hypothetical protein